VTSFTVAHDRVNMFPDYTDAFVPSWHQFCHRRNRALSLVRVLRESSCAPHDCGMCQNVDNAAGWRESCWNTAIGRWNECAALDAVTTSCLPLMDCWPLRLFNRLVRTNYAHSRSVQNAIPVTRRHGSLSADGQLTRQDT